MPERHAILRHIRFLDWVLIGAIGSGVVLGGLWTVFALVRGTFDPFPTFGGDLSRIQNSTFPAFGLLWLVWAVSVFFRAVRRRVANAGVGALLGASLMAAAVGCFGWFPAVSMVNALLDLSSKTATPIQIQGESTHTFRTTRFGATTSPSSRVNRVAHPDESVRLSWPGCELPDGAEAAPFVTLMVGRGALGVPWFALPVQGCRALAVNDLPLFDGFVLGAGRPLLIIALSNSAHTDAEADASFIERRRDLLSNLTQIAEGESVDAAFKVQLIKTGAKIYLNQGERASLAAMLDGLAAASSKDKKAIGRRALDFVKARVDLQDEGFLLDTWLGALGRQQPDVIFVGSDVAPDVVPPPKCARCRSITRKDLNRGILRLFTSGQDPWTHEDHIYLADGQGHRVFAAGLKDIQQVGALRTRVAELHP